MKWLKINIILKGRGMGMKIMNLRKIIMLLISLIILASTNLVYAEQTIEPVQSQGYRISGYIKPNASDKSAAKSGFSIYLGETMAATSNNDGYFEMINVPDKPTGYTIKIVKNGYLKRMIRIDSFNKDLDFGSFQIEIWAGDIAVDGIQDDAINMSDITRLASCFNSSAGDGRYNTDYDLNIDNAVNLIDIIIAAKHFNTSYITYSTTILTKTISEIYTSYKPEPAIPEVSCSAGFASDISASSAIIKGSIYVHDYSYSLFYAYWESSNPELVFITSGKVFRWDGTNQEFAFSLNCLKSNTEYTFIPVLTGPGINKMHSKTYTFKTLDK